MGTPFIPLGAIIAVLIIAFLFASLPQVNHKTRYRVLYAIAIIMLLAVIRYCSRIFLYVHCCFAEIQRS